jgi:1-acyl-sn-glycerol-3-phosphate acyltransferase
MQNVVLEEPYEFVPPVESDFWCWVVRFWLRPYLRKHFGVVSYECRHAERLRASLDSGASVVMAANHSRLSDPLVLGILAGEARCELFAMASWHLFKEGWRQRFLMRRMGAFSVYREGNDRASVNKAIEILVAGRRPLLIFPEGAVSRHNDLLMELMDGPGFIARQAAKRRAKEGKGPVVIHPVTIRYSFGGDPAAAIGDELAALESGFSWRSQTHLPLSHRLMQAGEALLSLKEVEYLGGSQSGDPYERAQRLTSVVLHRLERKWGTGSKPNGESPEAASADADKRREASIVARVKAIRGVVLPDLVAKKVTPAERDERWRDLAACYYVQQIAHYPRGYVTGENDLPERVVETFERLVEDYQDKIHYHGPIHTTMVVGEAIPVSAERDRSASGDPAMESVARTIQQTLDGLADERRAELFGGKPR